MTPPTTTPATGETRRHYESHHYGLVLFASVVLIVSGCFNLVQGIAAAAGSHVFHAGAHLVFAKDQARRGQRDPGLGLSGRVRSSHPGLAVSIAARQAT
jgi:hypothetical protein